MIERITEEEFVEYFRCKKEDSYIVDKLSEVEKEYWSLNTKVLSCRKKYIRENKNICFLTIRVNEVNIYDIVAILFEFNEVRYITPNKKYILEEYLRCGDYLLFTDSEVLPDYDYYLIENFEHIKYEFNMETLQLIIYVE